MRDWMKHMDSGGSQQRRCIPSQVRRAHPQLVSALEEPWQGLVPCRDKEMLFLGAAPVLCGCFCWLAVTAWFSLGFLALLQPLTGT